MCAVKSLKKITFQRISKCHGGPQVCQNQTAAVFIHVFPSTRTKQTMLKITVIENQLLLQINNQISVWLMTALDFNQMPKNGVLYGTELLNYITCT